MKALNLLPQSKMTRRDLLLNECEAPLDLEWMNKCACVITMHAP